LNRVETDDASRLISKIELVNIFKPQISKK